jgi:heat shock transcription factor
MEQDFSGAMSDTSQATVDERASSMQRGVPQFLVKLYKMTNNPQHCEVVVWSDDNNAFWVADIAAFSRDVLPSYFKHNNYASFVRQLNMYGKLGLSLCIA